MIKKSKDLHPHFKNFEDEVKRLETQIFELENKMLKLFDIERNHLLRVKNHEELSDDFILNSQRYQDLSPEKAFKLYRNPNFDFVLIDVSAKEYNEFPRLPEAILMPWENFFQRFMEIVSHSTPILVISEDGTTSILACEFLVKRGYYNCNNVSGGYKAWRGYQLQNVKKESA